MPRRLRMRRRRPDSAPPPRAGAARSGRASALLAAATAATLGVLAVACAGGDPPHPPAAEFLLATPDSAYWVRSGPTGIRVRAVPMTLARYEGRFHEVYVADVDRDFESAAFEGERVYTRDLESGDSTLVYDDTAVVVLAAQHARLHPNDRPIAPDDPGPGDPVISVIGETDILGVRGPYVLLEHRFTFEHGDAAEHDTVRTAVDLRSGRAATLDEIGQAVHAGDRSLVQGVPREWRRPGYTLLARGGTSASDDAPVSFSMRDAAGHLWPLLEIGERPRLYWLDTPAVDGAARTALRRAFNDAAAYDGDVHYAALAPRPSGAPCRIAAHATART